MPSSCRKSGLAAQPILLSRSRYSADGGRTITDGKKNINNNAYHVEFIMYGNLHWKLRMHRSGVASPYPFRATVHGRL
jgi:hypothetical protein